MSGRAYDDERLAGAYEQGNEMPEASLRAWVELFASAVPGPAPAIVEISVGTGMFSAATARWIEGAGVLAVDPSEAMLSQARRHHPHPAVHYVLGSAEAVPDRPRAVCEPARVVRFSHLTPEQFRAGLRRLAAAARRRRGRCSTATTWPSSPAPRACCGSGVVSRR